MKKSELPEKLCPVCNRNFKWRKKWEKNWEMLNIAQKNALLKNYV